jgi:hypothetical protein
MNAVELLDESEGACTAGNFLAQSLLVKQHGAILGMQMHRNRTSRPARGQLLLLPSPRERSEWWGGVGGGGRRRDH